MNISYFMPDYGESKKEDKGLINPNQLRENAQKKAKKVEQSKNNSGLISSNEGRLLTNDGREIFNENK